MIFTSIQKSNVGTLVRVIQIFHQKRISIFSINDARKLFAVAKENTLYKILQRLEKKGIIKRIRAGRYLFALKEVSEFEISNFLLNPSYVSLESALSFYGILPQFPYTINAVTTKKTKKIIYEDKEYEFNHIEPKYFFGMIKKDNFMIATPEKALLDQLYFVSKGLRDINLKELDTSIINKNIIKTMSNRYNFMPLRKLIGKFLTNKK